MRNKQIKSIISAVMFTFAMMIAGVGAANAGQPSIDKTTIIITALATWESDIPVDKMKFGWRPQMDFRVNGPIANGSRLSVELSTPDGKPWVSFDCNTESLSEGEVFKVSGCGGRDSVPDEKMALAIGLYGLKINLKNELQGTNHTLFTGKFKVGNVNLSEKTGKEKDYKWYVDYDWALPIAEVFADSKEQSYGGVIEREAQPLVASFWYRGNPPTVAYLFYKGQQIADTETTEGGVAWQEYGLNMFDMTPFLWTKKTYKFTRVLVRNKTDPRSLVDPFFMEKNPGEYEVKVLSKGKLVRAVKFTAGQNGKIIDPGISQQNALGTDRITLFATVSGDDGGNQSDLQAWKSTAFFEGPLKGFGQ